MDIHEVPFLKELVDRVGNQGAYTEHGCECVRAGTEMGHRAQELQCMALLLDRVIRTGRTFHEDAVCLNLERLLRIRSRDECAGNDDRRADIQLADLLEIGEFITENDLQSVVVGSVIQHHKSEILRPPDAADPSSDLDLLINKLICLFKQFSYCNQFFHSISPSRYFVLY